MKTTTALAGRARREAATGPRILAAQHGALALAAIAGLAAVGPLLMLRLAIVGNHPWLARLAAAGRVPPGEGGLLVLLGSLAFLAVAACMRLTEAEAGEP